MTGPTTLVSVFAQEFTVLLEVRAALDGERRFRWPLLSPSNGTEQRVFRRAYDARVDGPSQDAGASFGFHKESLRCQSSDSRGFRGVSLRTKIRAERSSDVSCAPAPGKGSSRTGALPQVQR